MGRKKLHKTEGERLAAMRERSKQYYRRHRAAICEAKRARYETKKTPRQATTSSSSSSLTEEERKLKNRLKSQRYYQRKKSEIKMRRQNKSGAGLQANTSNSDAPQKRQLARNSWEQRLFDYRDEFRKALSHKDVEAYLESVATCYLMDGLRSGIEDAYLPYRSLRDRVQDFGSEILNNLGAGAQMGECLALLRQILSVIELLEDLEILIIGEGRARLMEKYTKRELLYQRRYRAR